MNGRIGLRTCIVVGVILGASAPQAQQTLAPGVTASVPGLAGLWETEIARKVQTGEIDVLSAAANTPPPGGGLPPGTAELIKQNQLLGNPPYNREWEQKARTGARRTGTLPAAHAICSPPGFPAIMEIPFADDGLFEILVTPAETLLLTASGGVRHIYTDGRQHPAARDLWPTPMGDSIGRWEGTTLVIDTIARKVGPISWFGSALPIPTAQLSSRAHFTEHLRRVDFDTLQDDMTIGDPERFAHPWRISIRYKRVTDIDRLLTVDCRENERNPVVNGQFTLTPP